MYPEILVGNFALSTHLVLNLLAAVVVGIGARLRSRRRYPDLTVQEIIDLTFYLFCGVLAGALLGATLPYWIMALFGRPLPPLWWMGWQNWFGAVTGGTLAGLLYCRRTGRPFAWSLDLFAPLLPLALAIVRLGCLMAGDAYGKETSAWPAMLLPDMHGVWTRRYPSQMVDILVNLGLMGILFSVEWAVPHRLRKPAHWPFEGFLFWLYVVLFCTQRFYFEFWRADTPPLWGPFSWNHLYCVAGLALAGERLWHGCRDRQLAAPKSTV